MKKILKILTFWTVVYVYMKCYILGLQFTIAPDFSDF